MKAFIGLILMLAFTACENQPEKRIESNKQSIAERETAIITVKKISNINFGFKPSIKETKWKGAVVEAASWEDANGKNVIIISELKTDEWEKERPEMKKHLPKGDGDQCRLA